MRRMEQLIAVLPFLCALVALFALLIRFLAFVLRLAVWYIHQRQVLAAPNEAVRAALQPPPELPEGLSKHTVLAFVLGSTAAGVGLIMRRPPPAPIVVQPRDLKPAETDPVELLVQRCETSQQCGAGCRCVNGNCHCAACDKKKGGRCAPAGKDAGSSSGSGSKAPGPSSGLARTWPKMAGGVAWAGASP